MNSALIVSSTKKATEKITQWLGPAYACEAAGTLAQARAALSGASFDVVILNAPLPDGNVETLLKRESLDALLLVPQDALEEVRARMEPLGVFTLGKPVSPLVFTQAIALLRAAHAKVGRLEAKIDEVRIVERAKYALIHTLHMSEGQAHRYIEKQAMDLRQSKRAVAERIIKTYEF